MEEWSSIPMSSVNFLISLGFKTETTDSRSMRMTSVPLFSIVMSNQWQVESEQEEEDDDLFVVEAKRRLNGHQQAQNSWLEKGFSYIESIYFMLGFQEKLPILWFELTIFQHTKFFASVFLLVIVPFFVRTIPLILAGRRFDLAMHVQNVAHVRLIWATGGATLLMTICFIWRMDKLHNHLTLDCPSVREFHLSIWFLTIYQMVRIDGAILFYKCGSLFTKGH